jgi:broad specificity phosphatase PhoE
MSARRLVLVRHGETVGNSRIRYYGRTDVPLSDEGRAQMRAAAKALTETLGIASFGRVFSSGLSRAREGACIIAGAAAKIEDLEEFHEVDFGDFEGLTATEIVAKFPREFARWERDRLAPDYVYPHGESRAHFAARVERGVARMIDLLDNRDRRDNHLLAERPSLLVAHRGVIRAIIRQLASVDPVAELGSIQVLVSDSAPRWRTEQLDFVPHLTMSSPGG